jgi:Ca2+-binding RTX toxin-like protein
VQALALFAVAALLVAVPVPAAFAATDPEISISDVTMDEGNSGITTFPFVVTLSAASDQSVSVDWHSASGTATADDDFVGTSGATLVFSPGETTKTIPMQVYGDRDIEPDETFDVVLDNPVNATIADATGVGTIVNDDVCQNDPNAAGPIMGTPGDDILCGTTYADVFYAGDGNDQIFAYGGADKIYAGPGDDIIHADAGPDLVEAGPGNDIVYGGPQRDDIRGRAGADHLFGEGDGDVIDGGDGADVIFGGWGPDRIRGGADADHIYGENDNDVIHGNKGNDVVNGGALLDTLYGDDGSDELQACDRFPDHVHGGTGHDTAQVTTNDSVVGVETRTRC